jgi:Leucine-rich repeat (LRR) protein
LFLRGQLLVQLPPEVRFLCLLKHIRRIFFYKLAFRVKLCHVLSRSWFFCLPLAHRSALGQLVVLDLCCTGLATLPRLDGLTRLATLWLSGNQFRDVPAAVGGLVALEELDLSVNPLATWPSDVPPPRRLRTLTYTSTPLASKFKVKH